MSFTAFSFPHPPKPFIIEKGERLNSGTDYAFQLILASLCQPTLAKWVWANCIAARKRVIVAATWMTSATLKVVKIVVMGYFSSAIWLWSPVIAVPAD